MIGGHYGKNKVLKVLGNLLRTTQLIPTAARFHADLAISHGSRAQVLVCKVLGIPTVMMHDYEHSTKTGFIEADWVFMPDVIPGNAMSSRPEQVLKYPGLKEDVYVPQFTPNSSTLSHLGITADQIARYVAASRNRSPLPQPGSRTIICRGYSIHVGESEGARRRPSAKLETGRPVTPGMGRPYFFRQHDHSRRILWMD